MSQVFLSITSVLKGVSEFAPNSDGEYIAINQSASTYIWVWLKGCE